MDPLVFGNMENTSNNRMAWIESQLSSLQQSVSTISDRPCKDAREVDEKVEHIRDTTKKLAESIHALIFDEKTALFNGIEEVKHASIDMKSTIKNLHRDLNSFQNRLKSQAGSSTASLSGNQFASPTQSDRRDNRLREILETQRQKFEAQIQAINVEIKAAEAHWQAEFEASTSAREQIESMLSQQVEDEQERCRRLFEYIQILKGNIRVMCRIRPSLKDVSADDLVDFGPPERGQLSNNWAKMLLPVPRQRVTGEMVTDTKQFDFERVFGPDDSNESVYGEIRDLVQNSLMGGKVAIFCYGQSGSGKTFTMSHRESADELSPLDGIIPQALGTMFRAVHDQPRLFRYSFELSLVEIYKDDIFDLLISPKGGQKTKIRIDQAQWNPIDSWVEANEMLEKASRSRAVGTTNLNDYSSRSHLLLLLKTTRETLEGKRKGTIDSGLLNLVDLAGSERAAQSGAEGEQLREGITINQSLTSLNRLITSLGQGTQLSFDSTLTKVLRPCFSKDCKTLMFVNVSPLKSDFTQTVQTLQKAQEASKAKLASSTRRANPEDPATNKAKKKSPIAASGLPTHDPSPLSRRQSTPAEHPLRRVAGKVSSSARHPASKSTSTTRLPGLSSSRK
ncbi:hypothetical protein JX266_009366 [Neoarthrinium moseri]|nr:hypothetical protein JX266_009366 [Neoarthrinium moseri]